MRFGDHVAWRAVRRRIGLDAIEAVVLGEHDRRRRNEGFAQWRVEGAGIVVLYDWPDGEDVTCAFVRTAWRR